MQKIFQTRQPVIIYPASGTGAREAALANTLSAGDQVLMYETGHFAALWQKLAVRLGLETEVMAHPGLEVWRHGVQAQLIEARLKLDTAHAIKAVCVVHNETSTGVTSNIAAVRAAIDADKHPALLLVDTISGLASADYQHDAWGVDVTISGSQKGLMLPPGISFNAVSLKAVEASRSSKIANLPKAFWAWDEIIEMNKSGYWPSTPNTNLLYALSEACDMLLSQGLDAVRKVIYERLDCSLGTGLGKVNGMGKGKMFRVGHLGDCNDLTLMAALAGCEMGLKLSGVKLAGSGPARADQFCVCRGRVRPALQGAGGRLTRCRQALELMPKMPIAQAFIAWAAINFKDLGVVFWVCSCSRG